MKNYILLFFCVLFQYAQAQETISGKVVDKNNKPLEFALISWKDTEIGAEADAQGNFSLEFIPDAILQISYVGFEVLEISSFPNKQNLIVTLKPEQALTELVINST